jgi:hypothetical protein
MYLSLENYGRYFKKMHLERRRKRRKKMVKRNDVLKIFKHFFINHDKYLFLK